MTHSQILRVISVAGAFLVGFWLPIRLIGYVPAMELEIFFDFMISLVSGVNIYLYFSGSEKDYKKFSSWLKLGVVFDVICLLPLSLFAFVIFDKTFDGILLFNLLCARHIRQIKPLLDEFDSLQPITYRLVPLIVSMPLLVHLIACGWIALGSGTSEATEDPILKYVRAIYWTFTTLTTVGYGDIAAKSISQMLFACSVQVVGVGVFGFILSNVASLLSRSDAAREHHMDNLDKVETFMNMHRIPAELRSKIRSYYHYLWTNKKGYQDQSLLEGLPSKIQSELFFHINKSIVEKVPFLMGASQELIEDLMNELEPRIFVPGERIFRAGDPGDALYFIQSGHIEILGTENKHIASLQDGAFFGEMALVSDRPRSATAKANSFCDLYSLSKESFDRVTTAYPEFKHHIEKVVQQRQS